MKDDKEHGGKLGYYMYRCVYACVSLYIYIYMVVCWAFGCQELKKSPYDQNSPPFLGVILKAELLEIGLVYIGSI